MITEIMQGDQYSIPIALKINGTLVAREAVSFVEVTVGKVLKTSGEDGGITFDDESGKWLLHLTQEDTFSLPPKSTSFQVRFKLVGSNDVLGTDLPPIGIIRSTSREVL